jgi:class 3 adenylate cyclase
MSRYKKKWPKTDFELKQRVGIDTSKVFVARTGIRGSNDLVSVGNAANNAAKMAALAPGTRLTSPRPCTPG